MVFRAQLQAFLICKRAREASPRPVKFNVSGLKVRKYTPLSSPRLSLGAEETCDHFHQSPNKPRERFIFSTQDVRSLDNEIGLWSWALIASEMSCRGNADTCSRYRHTRNLTRDACACHLAAPCSRHALLLVSLRRVNRTFWSPVLGSDSHTSTAFSFLFCIRHSRRISPFFFFLALAFASVLERIIFSTENVTHTFTIVLLPFPYFLARIIRESLNYYNHG